jgi:hypothetical protein
MGTVGILLSRCGNKRHAISILPFRNIITEYILTVTLSTNGEFDYNGISPVIAFTHSSIGCEEGSVPDYYTDTCSKLKCFIYAQ